MARTSLNVEGFEYLKGPSVMAAVTSGLSAVALALLSFDLVRGGALPVRGLLSPAVSVASQIALVAFFLLFYRQLIGRASGMNIRTSALFAAAAVTLSVVLDSYFRLRLDGTFAEFLGWLFVAGTLPTLMLVLFLGAVALSSSELTSMPIRRIAGVLVALMALQALLRVWSLVAELVKAGFRTEWSWSGWWAFLVRPSIYVLEPVALACFFLGIWKSDARAIRTVCPTPLLAGQWIRSRFNSADKLSKALLIAQVLGATFVLAGSVTYVAPYSEIWPLLGRVLLLPGSVIAIFVRPDRFNRAFGLLDNLLYTALAVTLNVVALRLWKAARARRSGSTES